MKKANVGKTKADWKPPQGYRSALGKARDKAKAKAKKVNSMIANEIENDSTSDDDDTYSQAGQSFSIQALTPFQPIRNGPSWSSAQASMTDRNMIHQCPRHCRVGHPRSMSNRLRSKEP